MKFIQIITGGYRTGDAMNHALYGLTEKGNVFKYEHSRGGWIQLKSAAAKKAVKSKTDVTSHISHGQHQVIDDDDVPF